MEYLLISSCILGKNTKYNGKNNYNPLVEKLKEKYELIYCCPEVDGGLSIPRDPSEVVLDKVISINGIDVTKEYTKGARIALDLVKKYNIKKALLKDGSPSCGKNYIYGGKFSHTKVNNMGIAAKWRFVNGVTIYTENDIEEVV